MKNNETGYTLLEVEKDIWFFNVVDGESFGGTLKEVVLFAIFKHQVKFSDIELAIQDMIKEGHNAAHFGMWKSFIYSYKHDYNVRRKVC